MPLGTVFPLTLALSVALTYAFDFMPNIPVNGSQDDGWQQLPEVPGARLDRNWPVPGTNSVMPVYQSDIPDTSKITRAIIVPGAKARDHWSYYITMQNIKLDLASTDPTFDPNSTSIMTPCFLVKQDIEAGAGDPNQLYWSKTGWFGGHYALGPNFRDHISSFDVLDSFVDHYTNASLYPNLETIVFAGHSAAAQFFQRYAAMRKPTQNDARVNYIVANPGSYLWLVADRPLPSSESNCTGIDEYKYGLASADGVPEYSKDDYAQNGRDGIVQRYTGRNVHYALGEADNGPGDTSCEASTQGSTHLERGNNFYAMLTALSNGKPNHTMDRIPGVSHQNEQMFNSSQLRERLFKEVTMPITLAQAQGNSTGNATENATGSSSGPSPTQSQGNSNNSNGASASGLTPGNVAGFALALALTALSL